MKKSFATIGRRLRTTCVIISLGALPLAGGLLATGCAGDRYHESTGESIDDTLITGRVKSALADDKQFKYEDIKVTTFKGMVQLSGFATTGAEKDHAAVIAKRVEGVKDVKNNITVKE